MRFTFSRRLAIIAGIVLPIAETVRRWHQLQHLSMWPAWLDDILLGAFLLYAAWRVGRDRIAGQRFLAAAWGCACGMGYFSFFGQLARLDQPDPSSLPSIWVVVTKGVMLLLAIAALIDSLRPPERTTAAETP
jgi:hypothetical protein